MAVTHAEWAVCAIGVIRACISQSPPSDCIKPGYVPHLTVTIRLIFAGNITSCNTGVTVDWLLLCARLAEMVVCMRDLPTSVIRSANAVDAHFEVRTRLRLCRPHWCGFKSRQWHQNFPPCFFCNVQYSALE